MVDLVYRNATLRQVFRKTGKALDLASAQISSLKHERDQLAATLDLQKLQKRHKVQKTAQERFVTMLDVRKVRKDLVTPTGEASAVTAQSPSIASESSVTESISDIEEEIIVSWS